MTDQTSSPLEPPICRDCAHLVGVRSNPEEWKEWKCGKCYTGANMISGTKQYETCLWARTEPGKCEATGTWFQLYEKPDYSNRLSARGTANANVLLNELENLK